MNATEKHNLSGKLIRAIAALEDLAKKRQKYGVKSREYNDQLDRSAGFVSLDLEDILEVWIKCLENRRDKFRQTTGIG